MTPAPRARRAPHEEDGLPPLSAARYDSFLVRLLRRGSSGGYVHGQVTHIASRRSKRFTDLQAVISFIQAQVGGTSADDSSAEPPK